MADNLAIQLISLLEPLAESNRLELVTVEVAGGKGGRIVRVFLDREGGIDIDAIADANEWIAAALDQLPALSGPYTLEVSSPGIERVLRKRGDFVRFAGQMASIQTSRPIDGRSRFTGVLDGIEGDDVLLTSEGSVSRVPLGQIERARLKADFGQAMKGADK